MKSTRTPRDGGATRGSRSVSGQRGAVTAEFAVALPSIVVLLVVVLTAVTVGASQLRLEEAARAGAREIMRGEGTVVATTTVQRLAGRDAELAVTGDGTWATVHVSTTVDGPLLGWSGWRLEADALARPENTGITGQGVP